MKSKSFHRSAPQNRWLRHDLGRRLYRNPTHRSNARFSGWFPLTSLVFWKVVWRSWNVPAVHARAPWNHMGGPAVQAAQQTQNEHSQYWKTMGQGGNGLGCCRRREQVRRGCAWHTTPKKREDARGCSTTCKPCHVFSRDEVFSASAQGAAKRESRQGGER